MLIISKSNNYIFFQQNRLTEIFKDTRRSILKMMEELQVSPALDFERMVCQDHKNFTFSSSNMSKVRDLKDRLKDQVEQARTQSEEKKETLISLWDCLDEPMEKRQAFFEAHPGYSLITINAVSFYRIMDLRHFKIPYIPLLHFIS